MKTQLEVNIFNSIIDESTFDGSTSAVPVLHLVILYPDHALQNAVKILLSN